MSEIISVKAENIRKLMSEAEISVETRFDKVTVVCVKLANGFVITEASGAVDPRNYSQEIGKRVCLERIEKKLWELEGYALAKQILGCQPIDETVKRQEEELQYLRACNQRLADQVDKTKESNKLLMRRVETYESKLRGMSKVFGIFEAFKDLIDD